MQQKISTECQYIRQAYAKRGDASAAKLEKHALSCQSCRQFFLKIDKLEQTLIKGEEVPVDDEIAYLLELRLNNFNNPSDQQLKDALKQRVPEELAERVIQGCQSSKYPVITVLAIFLLILLYFN